MKNKETVVKKYKVAAAFMDELDEQGKPQSYDGIVKIVKWESEYDMGYKMYIDGNGLPACGKYIDFRKKGFDPDAMLLHVVDIFNNMVTLTGISVFETK